jgi:hypothetical protein
MRVITRIVLATIALSVCLPMAGAQSSRLNELAFRLSTEASDLADASYRDYTGSYRSERNNIEQVMLAQQFAGAAQVFRRMVTDRRRDSDLRDAFAIVENLQRALEHYNPERGRWATIQRLMTNISAELSGAPSGGGNWEQHGRMVWKGKVDHDVKIIVRGNTAEVKTLSGNPYYDANTAFTAQLPPRRISVTLTVRKARGEVILEEQPSRANDYAAVVHIRDPKGGASDYEFELSW